ncbi:MAG: hypothetical protein K9M45_13820, partial [Kiritimatiellales bacterium]|nr:hypothetical protein [Kiritimatiellales bacterium]
WGRVGADGQPRELHIDKAGEVINWGDHADPRILPTPLVEEDGFQCLEILKCGYFRLEKLIFTRPIEVPMSGKTFHALFVAEGNIEIVWDGGTETAVAGTSVLVPASLGAYELRGTATVLRTSIP